jgi:colicin V production protein
MGSRKGLVRTVFGLFSSIVVLLTGTVISPIISNQLRNNDKIFNAISTRIEKSLENYGKNGKRDEQSVDKKKTKGKKSKGKKSRELINADDIYVPYKLLTGNQAVEEIITDILKNEHIKKAREDVQKEVNHRVAIYLTGIVINSGTFILVYFILSVGLLVLGRVLNIISKLPVINELNRMVGGIVGIFQGLVIVWLIFTLMMVFIEKPFIQEGMRQIEENAFLRILYESNIIAKIIGIE